MKNWEPGAPDWKPSPWLSERDEVLRGNEPGPIAGRSDRLGADRSRSESPPDADKTYAALPGLGGHGA